MDVPKTNRLSTEPYKGTRDFYPEDLFELNWIMTVMRRVALRFGYVEYSASILEPSELYRAKTGEEIVNEQTYTFIDRGDREVTLRPEMTPTVARMVAGRRRELGYPLRLYSIPNLFRYEQPQKGRLREHYQLNADLFGAPGVEADIEVISLAAHILKEFGSTEKDFEIRVNDRRFMAALFEILGLNTEVSHKISKLADKKGKMPEDKFSAALLELAGSAAPILEKLWNAQDTASALSSLPPAMVEHPAIKNVEELLLGLRALGINNTVFKPSLMRGFDYYTGMVFEIFDTNPENRRSLFGGGRYDELLTLFDVEPIPTVGFGMGDVTIRDFLDARGLLPKYRSPVDIYLCRVEGASADFVNQTAERLRAGGLNVAVDISNKKIGAQIETAAKHKIPYIFCIGENEFQRDKGKVKDLATGVETALPISEIPSWIQEHRN